VISEKARLPAENSLLHDGIQTIGTSLCRGLIEVKQTLVQRLDIMSQAQADK